MFLNEEGQADARRLTPDGGTPIVPRAEDITAPLHHPTTP